MTENKPERLAVIYLLLANAIFANASDIVLCTVIFLPRAKEIKIISYRIGDKERAFYG